MSSDSENWEDTTEEPSTSNRPTEADLRNFTTPCQVGIKRLKTGFTRPALDKLNEARKKQQLKRTNLALVHQIQSLQNEMANPTNIEIKDVITAIPVFSGDRKDLDAFINTCDLYVELIAEANQTNLLKIIKTKIIGEALAKISPINTLNSWENIKTRLREKIIKKISIDFAREDLNNVTQGKEESMEQYGNKIRKKLKALNEAIKDITENDAEIQVLRRMNEKHAISKFEQNIKENHLRILVSAAAKDSLDDCITFAIQKELLTKTKNFKKCNYCGLNGHETTECRRRQNNDKNVKKNDFKKTNYNYNKPNDSNNKGYNSNYNKNGNSGAYNNSTASTSSTSYTKNNRNYDGKNRNSNNIKAMRNEEETTIRDVLEEEDEDDEDSYQINTLQTSSNNELTSTICEIRFFMKNNEIMIEIPTSISNEKIKFCVDTGAQVSVIKPQKILDAKINTKNKINIEGVAKNAKLQSLGMVKAHLHCKNLRILHNFHVLNKDFNVEVDGIIGNDFLRKTGAKIDFENQSIQMHLPIQDIRTTRKTNYINKIRVFNEYDKAVKEYVKYETMHINTIKSRTQRKNPTFYAKLADTFFDEKNYKIIKNKPMKIKKMNTFRNMKTTPKHLILNTSNTTRVINQNERCVQLMNKLKLEGLNHNQREEIRKICLEYSDAFYIDGDRLKTTDVYQHTIKLKPDTDTVFVKQYRIPEMQKQEVDRQINELLKNNIIEKSTSRFNSPLLLVKKRSDEENKTNYRMVIDYRKLNEATINQAHPIPLIDEITDNLHTSEVFTVLDVYSAFHQILLKEDCRHLTAFSTSNAHYQFRCTPFGLQSSPIAWLYTINAVLRDFTNKNLFWYMDDIIIHEKDDKANINIIKKVLKQLIKHNIKLKPEKCQFLQKSVKFLGYQISGKGLEIDETRIRCIKLYPKPSNVQEVQRFCGFVNFYRKWVYDFAKTARPLYNLCKKDIKFDWNNNCQDAFEKLKTALITPPVLAFPRFDLDFILSTDASKVSCSGILANRDGRDERPIQYFSRSLNDAQTRYSAIELELLAIIWSVEWFRVYLYGRKFYIYTDHKPLIYLFNNKNMNCRLHRWRLTLMEYNFEVIHREGKANVGPDALSRIKLDNTDTETPLKTIFKVETRSNATTDSSTTEPYQPGKTKSQYYYIEEKHNLIFNIGEYDHLFYLLNKSNKKMHRQIQHKLKKILDISQLEFGELLKIDTNKSVALTPYSIQNDFQIEAIKKTLQTIMAFANQKNHNNIAINFDIPDPRSYFEFKIMAKKIFFDSNIKITFHLNSIIELKTTDDINRVLNNYHNTLLGGHASFERMFNNIRRTYRWHNMSSDIKNYVSTCEICQRSKITRHTKQPLVITSIPLICFETIFIDHVGKINPPVDGNAYILTIICDLSKFAIAIAVPDNGAETTARNLVEKVFIKYGFPSKIVSDNHKSFTGETMKQISKILKINQIFTSPYTPSSNVVERFHRTLANYIRAFVHKNPNRWPNILDYAVWAYNNTTHTGTNYSPFELVYGRNMSLPSTIAKATPAYTYDNYADELKINLKTSWNLARENLHKRKESNKKTYDELHHTKNLELQVGDAILVRKQVKGHKFENEYDGPFKITEITGPNSIKAKNEKGKIIRTHKNKIKKLSD